MVVTSLLCIVQYNYRFALANLYTDNEEVRAHFTNNLWACMLFYFFDSTQNVMSGIIKGFGLQAVASVRMICVTVFICIPLANIFAFTFKLGIQGLWLGLSIGFILINVVLATILYFANWS